MVAKKRTTPYSEMAEQQRESWRLSQRGVNINLTFKIKIEPNLMIRNFKKRRANSKRGGNFDEFFGRENDIIDRWHRVFRKEIY